jgi:shikimate dehydrogenase
MSALPGRLVLLGHPVGHSLSPAFQNAALAAAGIALRYEALDVEPASLSAMMEALRAVSAAGNVTVPHKEAVHAMCDERSAEAERAGAVNCFAFRDGRLVGHNTDIGGIRVAVGRLLGSPPRDLVFGVVGAGGAAAAVLAAVEGWPGCRAILVNRTAARARALVARFGSIAEYGDVEDLAARADIVVNATALGLRPDDPLPVDPRSLGPDAAVLDLVYSPDETRLVREARASGRRAHDGMSMLLAQGAAAFAWWFGQKPVDDVMWRAVGRTEPA